MKMVIRAQSHRETMPLATTTDAAQRMFSTAARADRQLMMASKFRYVGDINDARRFLDQRFVVEGPE